MLRLNSAELLRSAKITKISLNVSNQYAGDSTCSLWPAIHFPIAYLAVVTARITGTQGLMERLTGSRVVTIMATMNVMRHLHSWIWEIKHAMQTGKRRAWLCQHSVAC